MFFSVHPKKNFSAFLHGELDEGSKNKMEAHLSGCTACRQEIAFMETVVSAATRLDSSPAPDQLWDSIEVEIRQLRIQSSQAGLRHSTGFFSKGLPLKPIGFAFACLILAGLLIVSIRSWQRSQSEPAIAEFDMAPFLDSIESSDSSAATGLLSAAPVGFKPISRAEALSIAKIPRVAPDFPGFGYVISTMRFREFGDRKAIELVMTKESRSISVFIGSPGLMFTTAGRVTEKKMLGTVKGGKYVHGNLLAFFWGTPTMHCGFITQPGSEPDLAQILESFRNAYHPDTVAPSNQSGS